jgi:ligand-binding sensor domain-containing protein/signal transduction histidine kinase/CheY-like chemotaxis protein
MIAFLSFLLLPSFAPFVFSLDPNKEITQYIADVWRIEQGLPQNSVGSIIQTRDGYLWLATQEGLVRFDGVRFRVYDKRNVAQLSNHWIWTICEDREGNLWIGTYGGGLVHLNSKDGKFTAYTKKHGLSDDYIGCTYEAHDGGLWIGTENGLNYMKNGTFTTYTTNQGLAYPRVWSVCEDREGNLWIGTYGGGLNRFKNGKFTTYSTKTGEGLSADHVLSIYEDREGRLWFGTYSGLNRFKDGRFVSYTTKQGLSNDVVTSIYEDGEGILWIGTNGGGLNRLDLRDGQFNFTRYTTKQGLSYDIVDSIYEDREGSLWIGTDGGGLNRLKDGKFSNFTEMQGLSDDMVNSIYEDRQGSLWIGTYGGGLNRFKDEKFTTYTKKHGLASNFIWVIYEDRQGNLWLGTSGNGLNRFKDGKFTAYTTDEGLSNDFVWAVCEDQKGSLWIGTDHGLNCMDRRDSIDGKFTITVYTTKHGLSGNYIVTILEDREGNLWIGTDGGGLNRLNRPDSIAGTFTFTPYTTEHGLSDDTVCAIYEDREGDLWLGTYGGLNRMKDGKFKSVTVNDGLFDDTVFQIHEDDRANLWMSCNKGIFRVSKKELNDFFDGKRSRVNCVSYNENDGMKSRECNGGYQSAGCKSRDGKLWFPTIKGMVMIDPDHIKINRQPPPVKIEKIVGDNINIDLLHSYFAAGEKMVLSPGTEQFEIHYTGLSFLVPGKVRFKCKLEGFDKDWREVGTRRTAYYTKIPPGHYTFRVKACNNDGVWNETGTSISFYLEPYFYQTWWFYMLCALGAVFLAVGIYRLRVNQLTRHKMELERMVVERTTDLERKTNQLEQEITERKRAEEEAEQARVAAEEANRAKSEFLANISHELRTPLNAVIGFSELLSSMAIDQKQRNYTHSIRTAGKSLLTLINDILDLSKIESGMMEIKYTPVNPSMIFNEIEHIFHEKLALKNLAYITDIDENLPALLTLDETRLRQILLNLVGNAVKFTAHGHIKLSAKKGNETDQPDLINLIISVEDTGIGVPPEEQALIFQPFKQQSGQSIRKYGGTGLGLSICKRLTEMMKGRISVESQPGKGSCFKLVLENVTIPSTGAVTGLDESFNLDTISFEAARVLVVDDVESNRAMLQEMLPRVNLEVLTAENGQEALRIAGEYLPDIIIMDIVMPVMDGYEAANTLKSNPKTKDIPVLVLSASSTVEQKEKILESGFFAAYLEKPVDVNQLFKELSKYIPYSRTPKSASPRADDPNRFRELPEETLRRLPGLIKVLREEMLPLMEHFKGALKTEEVKKFADKINRLGEDFAVPGLIDYANRLNEFEQDFDIEGIEKSLADFPTMVKDLVLHMEAYNEFRQ